MANQYLDEELGDPEPGTVAVLSGAEARHAVRVSRIGVGQRIRVGNGSGLVATGTVTEATPTELRFLVDSVERDERRSPGIWLAQALAKGDRDELAVQAATELGVDGVIPWAAARSVSRWEGAKVRKGQERWATIVREATKQSARSWIPEVAPLMSTSQLAAMAGSALVIVLDPLADGSLAELTGDELSAHADIVLVVGPEGGIAPGELDVLYGVGSRGARLGRNILRTSTAGPAAVAVLSAKLGRW